uniref:Transferase hexapeptide repeat containing protein n=1 Tax=Rhodopseudomonas palustris (strain BisA53) TaxID=316055 RepID=Q07IQ2_RHOP5
MSGSEPTDLVIWGAKGHAKVLREFMPAQNYRIVALVDNNPDIAPPFAGVPVVVGRDGLASFLSRRGGPVAGIVAIGGFRGRDRIEIQATMRALKMRLVEAIHPTAFVAADAVVGAGSHVLAQAALATEARVGAACILNTSCSVDHECILGDGVHIAPGAVLAGEVEVGDRSFVGPGAVVMSGVRIGADTIIGAGSVVVRDIPSNVVAFGNPARIVRANARHSSTE